MSTEGTETLEPLRNSGRAIEEAMLTSCMLLSTVIILEIDCSEQVHRETCLNGECR